MHPTLVQNSFARQLEIAIKLDPRFGEAYFNYGIVLMNAGRYADAAAHFARAVDLDFSPDFVTDSLISSEIHANEPDAAVAALQTTHTKRLKHHASLHWQVAKFLMVLAAVKMRERNTGNIPPRPDKVSLD